MLFYASNYPQTFCVCSDINLLALNGALLCLMRREPRGFAFVQFVDPYEASEAQHHMNGKRFSGREISVVLAAESRKRPEEMRHRARGSRGPNRGGQRSSYYVSRSRSPRYPEGSKSRYRSRSYSVSPRRRHAEHPRSPRGPPPEQCADYNRVSYSPGYDNAADQNHNGDGYGDSSASIGIEFLYKKCEGNIRLNTTDGTCRTC
ncbi:hypothetical protein Ddye_018123 [Dipteronia dyeriana]|uniref:RRM domain-containing protein n=1 Tax=Dipteronia dyeriana TaxID=168575 RepID=A0AAD9UAH4_9ROSI|nr:hypothetical protein Ddye_018123 [Dipteronia dyeriana]